MTPEELKEAIKEAVKDAIDGRIGKQMTEDEKRQCAKDLRDTSLQTQTAAEKRGAEIADEFTRLEVQFAGILFGLMSLFASKIPDSIPFKFAYAVALVSLIASLGLGLLHLKRKEMFWDGMLKQRILRFIKWNSVLKREVSFEEARGYHEGTAMDGGYVVASPMWTWVMQSIFLGVAVIILLVLSAIFIFS